MTPSWTPEQRRATATEILAARLAMFPEDPGDAGDYRQLALESVQAADLLLEALEPLPETGGEG